jgi:hypothetical protein
MSCDLAFDAPIPSHFKGIATRLVNLSIKGTSGSATMLAARYNGAAIPINPATFTIRAGALILDMTVDNDTPGDVTRLLCGDGTVLDEYAFNAGDPNKFYTIRGL